MLRRSPLFSFSSKSLACWWCFWPDHGQQGPQEVTSATCLIPLLVLLSLSALTLGLLTCGSSLRGWPLWLAPWGPSGLCSNVALSELPVGSDPRDCFGPLFLLFHRPPSVSDSKLGSFLSVLLPNSLFCPLPFERRESSCLVPSCVVRA